MKLPNKVICYNESIISKLPVVLTILKVKECSIYQLFNQIKNQIEDVNELIDILDGLFALGKIEIREDTGRIYYVA